MSATKKGFVYLTLLIGMLNVVYDIDSSGEKSSRINWPNWHDIFRTKSTISHSFKTRICVTHTPNPKCIFRQGTWRENAHSHANSRRQSRRWNGNEKRQARKKRKKENKLCCELWNNIETSKVSRLQVIDDSFGWLVLVRRRVAPLSTRHKLSTHFSIEILLSVRIRSVGCRVH